MEAERFCSVIMEKFFFAETVAADGMRYGEKKRRGGMQHSNMTRGTDWFNNQEENHYSSFLLL